MNPTGAKYFTFKTLIDIFVTIDSGETSRTTTSVRAVNDARVADGGRVAGVGGAGVVQVAQEAGLAGRALAVVVCNAIMADSTIKTRSMVRNQLQDISSVYFLTIQFFNVP